MILVMSCNLQKVYKVDTKLIQKRYKVVTKLGYFTIYLCYNDYSNKSGFRIQV